MAQRVLICGGGVGGLTAALALSRAGNEVTLIERDPIEPLASPEEAFATERRGAPQIHHTHGFLARLQVTLRDRFPEPRKETPLIEVASPGTRESQAFIETANPDIVIALCKSILPERVFAIPHLGTFVFHPGICPEYRNSHGCFWALASDDLSRVGMTLVRIDKGVDTGPIFGHFGVGFDEVHDSHIRIQHRVVLDNLDALRARLLEIAGGTARPVDVIGRESRAWGQPWLTAWMRWKSKARRRAVARHRS